MAAGYVGQRQGTHDAWKQATFTQAEKESDRGEARKVMNDTGECRDDTPDGYEERQPSTRSQFLEHPIGRDAMTRRVTHNQARSNQGTKS